MYVTNACNGLEGYPRAELLRKLDISIEHSDEIKHGEDKGTFKTIGDEEHVDILKLYLSDAHHIVLFYTYILA